MLKNKVGMKLGFVIIAVFIVVLSILGVTIDRMFSNFYTREMSTEVDELATHFAMMAQTPDAPTEQMLLKFADFSNVSIFYVNKDGKVQDYSGEEELADASFIHQRDIKTIFSGQTIRLKYEAASGNRYFVTAKPIVKEQAGESQVMSALYVLSSSKHMDDSVVAMRRLLVLSGIGAFLLALGITWIVAHLLSRPLLQMQQATRKIAVGELETRLNISRDDEIGSLASAINNLAEDLQNYRDTRQEFFANISHELRTPITYLEGYSKVIKERLYSTEEERDQYLDVLHQEAKRLQHLVDDLFELSKMEEGKISLSLEWIDLAEVIDNAVHKVQLKASDKGLALSTSLNRSTSWVYGDGLRMEQVILNLLENSVRYTEQGEISIMLDQTDSYVFVKVKDTGIGIAAEELPYVFERFYRVEKSRSRQHGGTGLGLSIAKKLVELQGGEIFVNSRLGEGATFEIRFKLEEQEGST
ncbi:HAMP domain-containing histidine kinase [Paenibacillus motobuensis]|uniref:sensor histidine kinase n=1 Tax=Paenibacillus TaxID=44249 RepID=UPI00203E1037|nr:MULTISPECIES: HAMP domain-containing sensor histidine kinase [Paenibacillus]MCM3038667.1 HAMP domain-containing histidine kinase [Paenibacillus lutimineralis]MCM3645771.1 HAMP domain-containing histidine kinase [Paenibacillus motobuensis]